MRTYQLHLIRHGLTEGNLKGLYVGSGTDLPLCPEGAAQLEALRDRFTYPEVGTVFSSTLSRAVETAEILFPDAQKKLVIQDLREMAFGVYEGREVKDLVKDPDFARWMDPSSGYTPPHAEDTADFHIRCSCIHTFPGQKNRVFHNGSDHLSSLLFPDYSTLPPVSQSGKRI